MSEKINTPDEKVKQVKDELRNKKVPISGYIGLIILMLMFSGVLKNIPYLKGIDFNSLLGAFGKIGDTGAVFYGTGATGARNGFMVMLQVAPTVLLAMGLINVAERMGALDAAGKLLSFILRPVVGVPGYVALAMVASMTSSDAGASMNRDFFERGLTTEKERDITTMWLLCCAGMLTNYITGYGFVADIVTVPFAVPFAMLFVLKFIEANVIRVLWSRIMINNKTTTKGVQA